MYVLVCIYHNHHILDIINNVISVTYFATVYRDTVKSTILDVFAGPPQTGVYSPSVQHTLYIAEKQILDKIPQVSWNKGMSIN